MHRIGIDARMMGKGYGIGRYLEQLVTGLTHHSSSTYEYVLFLRDRTEFEIANSKFEIVIANIPWYSWQEQTKMPAIIRKADIDLMHFPHWNVPLAYNDPFLVTIHDLTMYHYPRPEATTLGPIKFWMKDRAHRLAIRHAVRRAKRVIATSQFTKQDVMQTLGVQPEKISVVYQSSNIDTDSFRVEHPTLDTRHSMIRVLEKYHIQKPYVLYVGAAYPHKNIERLIEAWQMFDEKYAGSYQLVFAGKEDYFYRRLKSKITDHGSPMLGYGVRLKRRTRITYLGFVKDADLAALYEQASLFIFPSLYEGFGIPPLEAMAHGVPVVSSNRSCLPEVLGEGALYFDPESIEDMAEKIHLGLENSEIRFTLRQNAKHELARYSSEAFLRETLRIYDSILIG